MKRTANGAVDYLAKEGVNCQRSHKQDGALLPIF